MNILEIKDVVKKYHNHVANDKITFNVPQGSIFGLLGPNGAGKTTLIRIITSITGADEGSVKIDGQPLTDMASALVGYMPEERGLYKKMKVGEQLLYLAQLKGMPKADAVKEIKYWFEKFEITSWYGKTVEELSKGMSQKIQFIATIIHKPKLLILDEPFSGLDPVNANLIKDEIYDLNKKGTSIIFSTHRMEQVEEICKEIVLIDNGRIILEGGVADVKQRFKEGKYQVKYTGQRPNVTSLHGVDVMNESPGEIIFKVRDGGNSNQLLMHLINSSAVITEYKEILPTLNEIFIKQVTNK